MTTIIKVPPLPTSLPFVRVRIDGSTRQETAASDYYTASMMQEYARQAVRDTLDARPPAPDTLTRDQVRSAAKLELSQWREEIVGRQVVDDVKMALSGMCEHLDIDNVFEGEGANG